MRDAVAAESEVAAAYLVRKHTQYLDDESPFYISPSFPGRTNARRKATAPARTSPNGSQLRFTSRAVPRGYAPREQRGHTEARASRGSEPARRDQSAPRKRQAMSASAHAGIAVPLPSGFVPLRPLARWAISALFLVAVSDVVAIWSDLRELSLVNKVINGDYVSLSALQSNDSRQTAVGWAAGIVYLLTVVVFLRWFSKAYKNLVPLGAVGLRYRPGWAIGAWFVPFLLWWRPKQIANDIWRASDPDNPEPKVLARKASPAAADGLVGGVANYRPDRALFIRTLSAQIRRRSYARATASTWSRRWLT